MNPINVGNLIVNNYLYPADGGYVLVDTGYENGFSGFLSALRRHKLTIHDISYVFLTHAHDDHAGFLNRLLEVNPHAKVVLSGEALRQLRQGHNSFEGGCTSRLALLFCALMKLAGKGDHTFPPLQPVFEDRCIVVSGQNKHELEKKLGGKIYETPGHTACSISLLLNNGILFVGDAAMNGFPSLHRITIWAEDKELFGHTWQEIIDLQPKTIYPGHGKPFAPSQLEKNLKHAWRMRLLPLISSAKHEPLRRV